MPHHGQSVAWVDAYDPTSGTWSQLTSLPASRASGIAGPLGEGFFYATGGTAGGWTATPQ